MSKDIRTCPFCGSEACSTYNTNFGFQVFCSNEECFMNDIIMTEMETEEQAIQVWNKQRRYGSEFDTPKKPKGISITYEGHVGNCPNCNKFVTDKQNRCDCNQALDWSDDKKNIKTTN